jgi:hypothetical protein
METLSSSRILAKVLMSITGFYFWAAIPGQAKLGNCMEEAINEESS